jgi:hypothetical protein
MPNWNEAEYVERAKVLARSHVASQKPINDLAEKVARDHALNPDEIRTLVRMTNVQVFGEKFASMSGDDKNVVFDVGDPELVIHKIVNDTGVSPVESANIYNDKLAHEIPDFMTEIRLGHKFDEPVQEKVASDEIEIPLPRRDMLILCTEKLAEDMQIESLVNGQKWDEKIAQINQRLRRAPGYGLSFDTLEKNAFASLGEEARPELQAIADGLRRKEPLLDFTKVGYLQEHHVPETSPELETLKEALEARTNYVKLQKGVAWLNKNKPSL